MPLLSCAKLPAIKLFSYHCSHLTYRSTRNAKNTRHAPTKRQSHGPWWKCCQALLSLCSLSRFLSLRSADSLAWRKWPHSAHGSQAAHSRNSPQRGEAAHETRQSRSEVRKSDTSRLKKKERKKQEKTNTRRKLANKLFVCIVYCGKRRLCVSVSS